MIPDLSRQRTAIVEALQDVGVQVFPAAPAGTLPTQFVLIGMPTWRPPTAAVCMDVVEWGVMVCVGRSGTNDSLTALALEGLWPQVLGALDSAIDTGAFGGVCTLASLKDATFQLVTIQGQDLPAQIITLEMQGA